MMARLKVMFCGDLAPIGRNEEACRRGGDLFSEIKDELSKADLTFANFECPLTDAKVSIAKSGPALRASPECGEALYAVGINVVGLANNHCMDYGERGLLETIETFDRCGVGVVGAGQNIEKAREPKIFDVKGVKIAIIALAEQEFSIASNRRAGAAPLDPVDNYYQIMEARARADIVIVTMHAGNEYFPYPRPGLRKLCHYMIELGVDAIINHHPHVPGAYEYYRESPIVYSMGNFLFDSVKKISGWDYGYMVTLEYDLDAKNLCNVKFVPYHQSFSNPGIKLLDAESESRFIQDLEVMREALRDEGAWLMEWEQFCEKKSRQYIVRQYFPFYFRGVGYLSRHLPIVNMMLPRSSALGKLNMLRCDSHRETLIRVLENRLY